MIHNPERINDYARIKIGSKAYDDAVVDLSYYKKMEKRHFRDKEHILKALMDNDVPVLRELSNYFYRTNGIYQKVVNYYATMYRFDWYMAAEPFTETVNEEKVAADFVKALTYFDNSNIKKICGEFALKVIRDGVCYEYAYEGTNSIIIQDLPWQWCRSRFKIAGMPAIEFNMKFFDEKFLDAQYRMKMLDLFPPEFKKGYMLYKAKKLPSDNLIDKYGSWYLLDPACAFKFALAGTNDVPIFVNALPEIVDLGVAQDIDRKRQLQQLLKIIVQKLPIDKNGDLIFDVDEARDIHNNAVEMLMNAIGVDVLTTFADIEGIDVSDASTLAKDTSLDNAEKTVYNALGVSKNIFNSQSNLALSYSVLADEGSLRDLVYQFEALFNRFAQKRSSNKKKWTFKFYMLMTTQYNYQALAKLYKEHTQIGFSKMLPQIALGQSQSFILNTAFFENEILRLSEIMLPPLMSSTLSAEDLQLLDTNKKQNANKTQESSGGRPPKEESELSEKTIRNKESQ